MNILITGGLGFIGSRLARALDSSRTHQVVILDNLSRQVHGDARHSEGLFADVPGISTVIGDIRDEDLVGRLLGNAEIVVHLAAETGTAQSMYEIARYNSVNSQGTATLLNWLANNRHKVRKIVLASSRSIYGEGAYRCSRHGTVFPAVRGANQLHSGQWDPGCPMCGEGVEAIATPETAPTSPASIYAATKYAQEDLVRISGNALGIGTIVLRFQNVYGPGQSLNNPYTGLLSIFSTRIRRGITLPVYEDGLESRDFVHVDDVVHALVLAIESDSANGATLNIGSGVGTSIMQVAEMLATAMRKKVAIEITGAWRLGDIRHCYADLSQARARLGYSPSVSLERGLAGFAAWVESQPLAEDRLEEATSELRSRQMMP